MQKILIVDDKEQNLFTLKKVLADLDVGIVQATQGNEALKATLHDDFALAILDVQMPGMDGYELAELLRYDATTENLPIIFLSAVYHDSYHVFKGYESGAVDFIIKPYEPKILLSKVKFFLQLHKQKISLQKAVELEKANNYLESILFSMTDAVFAINLDGCIETCNQGGLSLVNFDQGEIIGKPLREFLTETKYNAWIQELSSVNKPEALRNQETSLITADKGEIPVFASASPRRNALGELNGAVFVLRDLRDRKKLEEQVYQAKRMESIGLMAGGVAHDLNNILAGIIGYPELLLNTLPENSTIREPLEAILESGQRAAMVVTDLLTIARGAAIAKEVQNLNVLIQEYMSTPEYKKLKSLYPDISYKNQLEATQANIFCSPIHVKKCLMNLITNAAEAITDKGTIVISTQNEDIDALTEKEQEITPGEYIVLSVKDTGSGISSTDLKHIFEPFYTKKVMGRSGTGLGLTVVWNTIKDHESNILVTSGKTGTCFQLYFPLSKKEAIVNNTNNGLKNNREQRFYTGC
ncbi:MAG: hybrid sensor histidine kinase/response regulator [Candidatus Electrothrix sp. AR4]|nr:hybrid sensor histidine kinase/response regulator [Candidatus Electrothrix sp. AR4]